MKRGKLDSLSRLGSIQVLVIILFLYLISMTYGSEVEYPVDESTTQSHTVKIDNNNEDENSLPKQAEKRALNGHKKKEFNWVSGLVFNEIAFDSIDKIEFSELHRAARDAFVIGRKVFEEIRSGNVVNNFSSYPEDKDRVNEKKDELSSNDIRSYSGDKTWVVKKNEWSVNTNSDGNDEREKIRRVPAELTCPDSVILTGEELYAMGSVMEMPCGLMLGSHITIVGKPRWAHPQNDSGIARSGIVQVKDEDESVMVSQFIMELQGLRTVDGEDPPKVLHFNPRLKGDWSGRPVIEQNTYDRMQWGAALRCEGWKSRDDEETVDGQVKCENWIHDDDDNSEESRITLLLKRLIWRTTNYPFAEDKLFVLTLSAGMEGYHVNVDGRHVTSFPYRTGFALEDVTGLLLKRDVDVHSIFSASLPTSHPSFAPQRELEMLTVWQAPHLPNGPVELFIGILSAGNHFAERMSVRKSWMQHPSIRSSDIVARFFVAMHGRKEVNVELMKEAEFFGDIIIVPYMDNYDLGALKTVAICKYGVWTMAAKYIMKCDDDTFVRIDAVMKEVEKIPSGRSLYFGNINYHSKPSRNGKWTVTYEEWPEEDYPPYANGDGYVLSSDIAHFIVSEFEKHKLRLFKMEDVSVGMWIQQFNSTRPVEYVHSFKFFHFGCVEDYYTAHYQSPTQMTCLWRKLQHRGKAQCCNIR